MASVTIRLFMVSVYWLAETVFFFMALLAKDEQKRHRWLLLAIWCSLGAIAKILGAIAIHTGAFPLWNNR